MSEIKPTHEWKEVPGFPGFEAHPSGLVRSKKKTLKPRLDRKGYHRVDIRCDDRNMVILHRIIALTFIPNPYNLPQVNHKNGVKTDNRVENLEWMTNKQNCEHAAKIGLIARGEKQGHSKLTVAQVREIKKMIGEGETQKSIGLRFGVTEWAIAEISAGRNWAWL